MSTFELDGGRVGGAATRPLATVQSLPDPSADPDPTFMVGVIDTGVALVDGKPHPFLAAHLADTWRENVDPAPAAGAELGRFAGHGTFVAGLIVREAPAVTIDMRNALAESETHKAESETHKTDNDAVVAAAIRDLAGLPHLRLINLSFFGEPGREFDEPLLIKRELEDLFRARPEVLVITAAGNVGRNALTWPAAFSRNFEQVIAVGAADETVIPPRGVPPKASFSNFGSWVDVFAPGVQVLGPTLLHEEHSRTDGRPAQTYTGWSRWSGTSFAAATVTGLIAHEMTGDERLSGAKAREKVLRGPRVPVFGIADEHWAPYVRGKESIWSADVNDA